MSVEEIAERLEAIAEEIADLALDRLHAAAGDVRRGGDPDPAVIAEERRLTRARRSVQKAADVLRSGTTAPAGTDDDGAV
jgi:hypothetical protein